MRNLLKKITIFLSILVLASSVNSCTTTNVQVKNRKIPPGKMKKIMGTKSAKPFAPGQQKKRKK